MDQSFRKRVAVERKNVFCDAAARFLMDVSEFTEKLFTTLADPLFETLSEVRTHQTNGRVHRVIAGAIAFHASGCAALWRHCKEKQLDLLVDVHTHPGPDVRQSPIDERHPMMPIVGHTAMIVPNFARTACWSLKLVGVYEYLGGFKWRTYPASAPNRRVKLSLW